MTVMQYERATPPHEQLERTAEVAVEEEVVVREEPYTNQFEKELKRIMKESGYANVSQIYRKFYKESGSPQKFSELLHIKN